MLAWPASTSAEQNFFDLLRLSPLSLDGAKHENTEEIACVTRVEAALKKSLHWRTLCLDSVEKTLWG